MSSPLTDRPDSRALIRRHFLFGWVGLLISMIVGLTLESLHGLKLDFYLDPDNDTRRLMWTLAHAHGSLLSLVHVAFASYLALFAREQTKGLVGKASWLVTLGWLAMPTGFFLGGLWHYQGDPGMGIFLVPAGAFSLIIAMILLTFHAWRIREPLRAGNRAEVGSSRTPRRSNRNRQ